MNIIIDLMSALLTTIVTAPPMAGFFVFASVVGIAGIYLIVSNR